MEKQILEWLANGKTGISSKTIAFTAMGVEYKRGGYPRDPADFNRCLLLVREVPEIQNHLHKVAKISDVWHRIIDNWQNIEHSFIKEVGWNWCEGHSAPRTYDMIQKVIKGETL